MSARPWWQAVCGVLSPQSIFALFALFLPCEREEIGLEYDKLSVKS